MRHPLLELELANDRDMIGARQRARQVSALLDFERRIRCASRPQYPKWRATPSVTAAAARIEFALEEEGGRNPTLSISIADNGPGSPTSKPRSAARPRPESRSSGW